MNDKKEYLLDGEPISWVDLIDTASKEGSFRDSSLKSTSEAASILRANGHTVESNNEP